MIVTKPWMTRGFGSHTPVCSVSSFINTLLFCFLLHPHSAWPPPSLSWTQAVCPVHVTLKVTYYVFSLSISVMYCVQNGNPVVNILFVKLFPLQSTVNTLLTSDLKAFLERITEVWFMIQFTTIDLLQNLSPKQICLTKQSSNCYFDSQPFCPFSSCPFNVLELVCSVFLSFIRITRGHLWWAQLEAAETREDERAPKVCLQESRSFLPMPKHTTRAVLTTDYSVDYSYSCTLRLTFEQFQH